MKVDNGDGQYKELHEIFKDLERNFEFFIMGIHGASWPLFQENFKDVHNFSDFNAITRRKIDDNGNINGNINPLLEKQCQMILIYAYDCLMESKYNHKINKSNDVIFLKYLRHGAAHGNRFNIAPPLKKDIIWRSKAISNKLNKTKVVGTFINFSEIFILFSDISNKLNEIDNNLK